MCYKAIRIILSKEQAKFLLESPIIAQVYCEHKKVTSLTGHKNGTCIEYTITFSISYRYFTVSIKMF
jgi:hypothetical protein